MGKLYLFNPQTSDAPLSPLSVFVNGDPTPYRIRFTTLALDYVPFSTSGDRAAGPAPEGNKFVPDNTLLISGVPPTEQYRFDIPSAFPVTQDLILYIFQRSMVLLGGKGVLLREYRPQSSSKWRQSSRAHPAGARSQNGTVYVFNIFSERMELFSPNGVSAGVIPAWSQGRTGEPPIYTPSVLKVGRVLNLSEAPGNIVNGTNAITLLWPSGRFSFQLHIDGSKFPISQDLLLFILRDFWLLADQFGVQRGSGPIK
jgi:hypothetical protein